VTWQDHAQALAIVADPHVGAVVWFWVNGPERGQMVERAAIVTRVVEGRSLEVDLWVLAGYGMSFHTNVPFGLTRNHWCWPQLPE
jgi:hypothetical protein